MGKDYEDTRLADVFINLTDETIFVYDNADGNICGFSPQPREIPTLPACFTKTTTIHYIVNREIASTLKAFRPLDDIAVVCSKFHGRGGVLISYLVWAEDFDTTVCLYAGRSRG